MKGSYSLHTQINLFIYLLIFIHIFIYKYLCLLVVVDPNQLDGVVGSHGVVVNVLQTLQHRLDQKRMSFSRSLSEEQMENTERNKNQNFSGLHLAIDFMILLVGRLVCHNFLKRQQNTSNSPIGAPCYIFTSDFCSSFW